MKACASIAAGSALLLLAACSTAPKVAAPEGGKPVTGSGDSSIATTALGKAANTTGIDYSVAEQRFQSALKLMKDKQNAQARDAFAALAKDYPTLTGPLTDLGILQAQSKQKDAALQNFTKAVEADPHNAVAYNWLGMLYRERGDYTQSELAYKKALAAHRDYALAHYNLGVLYDVYLHRPKDAADEYSAYLSSSGKEDIKVQAWIKALQTQPSAPVSSPVSSLESSSGAS